LHDKQGRIVGAIETLQDITERKQAEVALTDAKHAAEAAAETKATFLANMSHEIRTPMNAVIGLAHLLLKGDLSGKQRDYISRIHGAAKMLLGVINDVLDFPRSKPAR
jgi:signal transduction histidine kinase